MYIRTKDGVYEVDEIKPYFLDEKQKLFINNGLKIAVNEKQVIKQADTIEELCDRFVVNFECFNRSYYFIYKNSYDELKRDVQTIQYSAYGAIWTSKGLIFVAKMNDKGDLILI